MGEGGGRRQMSYLGAVVVVDWLEGVLCLEGAFISLHTRGSALNEE